MTASLFSCARGVGLGYSGSGDADAITVDAPVFISGFGPYAGSGEIRGDIRLLRSRGESTTGNAIFASATCMCRSHNNKARQCLFDEPYLVPPTPPSTGHRS